MNLTVHISNKAFWVQTWKMLSDYAKQSQCSGSKRARTNDDGTVSVHIDRHLVPDLIAEMEHHNKQNEGRNTLSLLVCAEEDVINVRRLAG